MNPRIQGVVRGSSVAAAYAIGNANHVVFRTGMAANIMAIQNPLGLPESTVNKQRQDRCSVAAARTAMAVGVGDDSRPFARKATISWSRVWRDDVQPAPTRSAGRTLSAR
jgi:hypothetical protein